MNLQPQINNEGVKTRKWLQQKEQAGCTMPSCGHLQDHLLNFKTWTRADALRGSLEVPQTAGG